MKEKTETTLPFLRQYREYLVENPGNRPLWLELQLVPLKFTEAFFHSAGQPFVRIFTRIFELYRIFPLLTTGCCTASGKVDALAFHLFVDGKPQYISCRTKGVPGADTGGWCRALMVPCEDAEPSDALMDGISGLSFLDGCLRTSSVLLTLPDAKSPAEMLMKLQLSAP